MSRLMTDVDRNWRYVIGLTLIVGYVGPAAISLFHQVPATDAAEVFGQPSWTPLLVAIRAARATSIAILPLDDSTTATLVGD
jgi:hypothetical protein